jgi:hypothetical protein
MSAPHQLDLVELAGGPMLTRDQRKKLNPRKSTRANGYAKRPGSGPQGETCKSCAHIRRIRSGSGKGFRKCGRMEAHWTRGPGSDILASAPACSLWEAKAP